MSTTPRLPSALPDLPPNMGTLLAHQPALAKGFSELYAQFWSHGSVDHPTKETVRLRNARTTDCGYWINVRFAVAKHDGLDEAQVEQIDDSWHGSALSDRQKAALGFADAYLEADGPMSAEAQAAFDAEFDPAQQTELGVGLALFHGVSKVLIALGCEPDEMDTTELPTPGAA